MSIYRVVVEETTTICRVKEFEAASAQDARELAEEDDWRAWTELEPYDTNAEIIEVTLDDRRA